MRRAQCAQREVAKRSPRKRSPCWGECADYNNLFVGTSNGRTKEHEKAGARDFCSPQASQATFGASRGDLQSNRGELRAACERGCVPDRGSCPQPPRHHHDASHYALVTPASVARVKPKAAKHIHHICCRLTHMCVCRDKIYAHRFAAWGLSV